MIDDKSLTQRKLTDEQTKAIYEHKRNLIVVAGAGSGKTFVLVERYLALLEANPEWPLSALVAITFTKKAAQEMRDRVRIALEDRLADAEPDQRDVWAKRISTMDSARIDTIHGLCASILRANAAEAAIDPAFEVLDEVNARLLLDDCIDAVLQAITHDEDSTLKLFTQYDTYVIHQTIVDLIGERIPTPPDDIMGMWQQKWLDNATQLIDTIQEYPEYRNAVRWAPFNGWPKTSDKLVDMWMEIHPLLTTLHDSTDTAIKLEVLNRLVTSINMRSGSAKAWGGDEPLKEAKSILGGLKDAAKAVLGVIGTPPDLLDQHAAQYIPLWVNLIKRVQESYRRRKAEDGILDFNDLEQLTSDLLAQSKTVRERYQGAEFKHVMVDEFQDTNKTQWEIVRGLAAIEQGGSLFVVGDPKQSIYQFRGADVSVFETVQEQIRQSGGIDVPLATSFRTHQLLVDGLNHVFKNVLVRKPQSPVQQYEVELGEPMRAHRKDAPSTATPIELLYLDKDAADDDGGAEDIRQWEAYEIATRIKAIVETEHRLIYDKASATIRPIRYGDIAILYQSMSNVLLYEDVFKTANLPFVTIAGKGYYSRQEVWDLLNLLTALHNPGDNLALASALRSPLFGLSDDALLALRLQRPVDQPRKRLQLWESIQNPINIPTDEAAQVLFAATCLNRLRSMAGRISIAELLQSALDETGYLATLTGLPDGARRRGNIEKLIEKAQESKQVTLGAFSQYLRDLSSREVREGEALVDVDDSVTLMTVHASKGLEFPLVVLVDLGWNKGNFGGNVVSVDTQYGLVCKVYDTAEEKLKSGTAHGHVVELQAMREIAERKRLLYVAATRAQDYLILSGYTLKSAKNTWLEWVKDAFELTDSDFQAGTQLIEREWGHLQISVPEYHSAKASDSVDEEVLHDWTSLGDVDDMETANLLVNDVRYESGVAIRHITATQIADAGSAHIDPLYRRRFRRSIFKDAPLNIEQISLRKPDDVSRRIIGEMVHKVMGWWDFSHVTTEFDERLDSYAWELGVVDNGQRKYAIQEAHKFLNKMRQSPILRWLTEAHQLYREIPFVYRSEKRIIHGVLDTLIQRSDGSWVIVDYKTSHVKGYVTASDQKLLHEHAIRYHLQIGVYSAAVQEQLGDIVPETYIYYIRYGEFVRVETVEWTNALTMLEATIGNLLTEQAD